MGIHSSYFRTIAELTIQSLKSVYARLCDSAFIIGGILVISALFTFSLFVYKPLRTQSLNSTSVFDRVKDRNILNCGIEGNLPHFSDFKDNKFVGFDADYCRVIAVAMFGELTDSNIDFKPVAVKNNQRFESLLDGSVDVVVRNTTFTVGREIKHGVTFGPIIYYDIPGILVRQNSSIDTVKILTGDTNDETNHKTICVAPNTSTFYNIEKWIEKNDYDLRIITKDDTPDKADYNNDTLFQEITSSVSTSPCQAIASDKSQLVAKTFGVTEKHKLIDVTLDGKEPLAPMYKAGDHKWARLVNYAVYATIYAAERDTSKDDFKSMKSRLNKDDLPDQHSWILGKDICHIAEDMGISKEFIYNIISKVGNYYDIYEAENNIPEKDVYGNELKKGDNRIHVHDGLHYSPPFTHPDTLTEKLCE